MTEHEHKHEVRIHIDQHRCESPNPTTGEALYKLGNIAPGMFIYREVTGNHEDEAIENGPEIIHLHEDEHFHSGPPKTYIIYVNGQEKKVTTKILTYDQIVSLAFSNPPTGPNILITVGYEDGPHENSEGSLLPSGKVKIKNGMIFNVTATDKS